MTPAGAQVGANPLLKGRTGQLLFSIKYIEQLLRVNVAAGGGGEGSGENINWIFTEFSAENPVGNLCCNLHYSSFHPRNIFSPLEEQ